MLFHKHCVLCVFHEHSVLESCDASGTSVPWPAEQYVMRGVYTCSRPSGSDRVLSASCFSDTAPHQCACRACMHGHVRVRTSHAPMQGRALSQSSLGAFSGTSVLPGRTATAVTIFEDPCAGVSCVGVAPGCHSAASGECLAGHCWWVLTVRHVGVRWRELIEVGLCMVALVALVRVT